MGCEGSSNKEEILKLFEFHASSGQLQQAFRQKMCKHRKGSDISSCLVLSLPSSAPTTTVSTPHSNSRSTASLLPTVPRNNFYGSRTSKLSTVSSSSSLSLLAILVVTLVLQLHCVAGSSASSQNNRNDYSRNSGGGGVRPTGGYSSYNNRYLNSRVPRESSSSLNIFPGYDSLVGGGSNSDSNNSSSISRALDSSSDGPNSNSISRSGASASNNNFQRQNHQLHHHHHRHHHGLNHPNSLQTAPVGG